MRFPRTLTIGQDRRPACSDTDPVRRRRSIQAEAFPRPEQKRTYMQTPLEIHFTNMERSDSAEASVRERVERLGQFFDGITSCHVFVDASHRRQRKGNLYEVRIEVRVPGTELAVNNKPGDVNAHEDLHVAIRDSFNAMERQLQKWKQQLR